MDHKNIDRLFREKLDQWEVSPSPGAWSQIENQIQSKQPTRIIYWIAASVALLLSSWMIWPNKAEQVGTPLLSEVSHPIPDQGPVFILPEITFDKERVASTQENAKQSTRPVVQTVNNSFAVAKEEQPDKLPVAVDPIDLSEAIAEVSDEPAEPILEKVETFSDEESIYQPVKITYIASGGSSQEKYNQPKADSTNAIKKFIAFTEKIDPGEMLADIRTAKDNLLSSGFKSKKDKNSL